MDVGVQLGLETGEAGVSYNWISKWILTNLEETMIEGYIYTRAVGAPIRGSGGGAVCVAIAAGGGLGITGRAHVGGVKRDGIEGN